MKKKKSDKPKLTSSELFSKNIEKANIGDSCRDYMQIFGANINLMRYIPSISDGIKPGERRILYTLYNDLESTPTKKKKKVSTVAGHVLNYHPHGDAPVMQSIVTMGQPWSNFNPLIEGEGNYGSPKGEPAAHGRYIEARLSRYAWKCFFEQYSDNLVDMKPTYGGDKMEPEYFPAVYPNALLNTTFGIGYGASCGLPSYNMNEVIELTLNLQKNPNYKDITLIPDSPTGAFIVDEGQFEEISRTGMGKFKMRGEIEVDEEKNALIIRSIPMQTNLNSITKDIFEMINNGTIQGFVKRDDNCHVDRKTGNYVIQYEMMFKAEVDLYVIRELIYKRTMMEKTFPVNFKLIDDYQDFDYNIRSLILHWLDFRRETLRRKFNYKLVEARERQHVLETILMVVSGKNGEKAVETIRRGKSKEEVKEYLMKTFKITSLQADRITSLPMLAFSPESIEKFKKEKEKVDANVEKYNGLIRSAKKIDKIIKEELLEGVALFGEPRRSKVIQLDGTEKIRNTNHIIVLTMNGFVKKLPSDTQSIGFINPGDYPTEIIPIKNTEDLMIFDETGKISKLQVHQIPNSSLDSEGEKLSKFCNINGSIRAVTAKPSVEALKAIKEPVYFLMVTRNGIIKKTAASRYTNIKNELLAMDVKEGDSFQSVKLMMGHKDILVYTSNGFGVRFNSSEVKETNRMSIGVKAINMTDDDSVIGMDIVNEADKSIFVLTSKGTGKKCTLENFGTMDRAAKPLRITSLEEKEDLILVRTVKGTEKFRVYLNTGINEILIKDVPELPRLSKGRKLIGVPKGSRIIDIREVK